MKTKGKVIDSTGLQRVYCPECGQLKMNGQLGEIRSLQPFVMPLDGELPKIIFVMERKLSTKAQRFDKPIEVDIWAEEYVLMRNLSEETKEKIRKELKREGEVGELSRRIAKEVREENDEYDEN